MGESYDGSTQREHSKEGRGKVVVVDNPIVHSDFREHPGKFNIDSKIMAELDCRRSRCWPTAKG